MAVKIRLMRFGRKGRPFYRIAACNSRSPRDGKALEFLGHYDPLLCPQGEKNNIVFNLERLTYWLSVGAQPTDRVQLFISKLKSDNHTLIKFIEKYKTQLQIRKEASIANKKIKQTTSVQG